MELMKAMKEMMEGQIGSQASRMEADRKTDKEHMREMLNSNIKIMQENADANQAK
jgi:hypothetical protein